MTGQTPHNAPPTIEQLEHELLHTSDPRLQLPLLHSLGVACISCRPESGRRYAREQLRLAKNLGEAEWMIRGYVLLSDWATIRARFLRALHYLEQAEALLKEHPGCSKEQALVYRKLGRTCIQLGRSRQALVAFNRALSAVGDDAETFDAAATYAAAGNYFQSFGQSTRALALFQQARRVFESLGFLRGVGDMLSQIGSIHSIFGDPEESLAHYSEGRAMARRSGDRHLEAFICKMTGDAYVVMNEFRDALDPYETAGRYFHELGDTFQWGQVLCRIGHVYASLDDFRSASRYCRQALAFYENSGNRQGRAFALTGIAEIQLYQKKHRAAVENFRKALELFIQLGQPVQQSFVHRAMARTFEEMGRVGDSLGHYKRYMQFEQEFAGSRVRQDLALIELEDQARELERAGESQRSRARRLESRATAREKELTVASFHLQQDRKLLEELRTRLNTLEGPPDEEVRQQIGDVIREVDRNLQCVEVRESLGHRFDDLASDFVAKLSGMNPSLTSAEKRVCMLLRINLANKEIALVLGVSPRTLEGQRLSIRRKLGLDRKDSLVGFLSGV